MNIFVCAAPGFNYSGEGVGVPICFSQGTKAISVCLQMAGITQKSQCKTNETKWQVNLLSLPQLNGTIENRTIPQDLPPCEKESLTAAPAVPWKQCHGPQAVRYQVPGTDTSIYHWYQLNRTSWTSGLYEGIWVSETGRIQIALWKLVASTGTIVTLWENWYQKMDGSYFQLHPLCHKRLLFKLVFQRFMLF